jgi:YgiT-type zinc finger domain-containing protein
MHYTCPDCHQDRESDTQVHAVYYRETTVVLDAVPGHLCPACGSLSLHPDTVADLDAFLRTRLRTRLRPRLTYSAQ